MRLLSQYVNEQLSTLVSQRMSINVQRLAYLKFAMADNERDKGLKKMYDTLYKLTFDKDGHVRTNKELLDYLKQTMEDNLGDIPGLPSNNAIEAIDSKIKALDELDPKKLQHYIKEIEKEVSNSENNATDKDKKVSLDKDISDKELVKKVSELIDKEGLSNILGLEKDRKMSDADKNKIKQKEDPIGSEEPEETKKDKSKKETGGDGDNKQASADSGEAGGEEAGGDESGDESNASEDDALDKELEGLSDEDFEDLETLDDSDFENPDELSTKEDEEEYTAESLDFMSLSSFMINEDIASKEAKARRKMIKKLNNRDLLSSFLRDNPGGSIAALIGRKRSKNQLALLQKRIDDAPDGPEKEKLQRQRDCLQKTSFDSRGKYIGDPLSRKAREKQLLKDGFISKDDILSKEDRKQLRLDAKAFANKPEAKEYLDRAKSDLENQKNKIVSGEERRESEDQAGKEVRDKEEAKEQEKQDKKDRKEFEKEQRQEKREERRRERRFNKEEKERKKQEEADKKEAEYQEWKRKKSAAQQDGQQGGQQGEQDEPDEVVKDDNGTEIRKRKKKNGDGYTYIRIVNGREEGYVTEEDFIRFKQQHQQH